MKQAQGVGPKLAQRIVLELKGKAPAMMAMAGGAAKPAEASEDAPAPAAPKRRKKSAPEKPVDEAPARRAAARADALSALVNLGYGEGEAAAAVAGAETSLADMEDAAAMTAALIRAALKALAK